MMTCSTCQGSGWIVVPADYKEGEVDNPAHEDVCPDCKGAGVVEEPLQSWKAP
jgi:DnaJ-class molecular chaperone